MAQFRAPTRVLASREGAGPTDTVAGQASTCRDLDARTVVVARRAMRGEADKRARSASCRWARGQNFVYLRVLMLC